VNAKHWEGRTKLLSHLASSRSPVNVDGMISGWVASCTWICHAMHCLGQGAGLGFHNAALRNPWVRGSCPSPPPGIHNRPQVSSAGKRWNQTRLESAVFFLVYPRMLEKEWKGSVLGTLEHCLFFLCSALTNLQSVPEYEGERSCTEPTSLTWRDSRGKWRDSDFLVWVSVSHE
jgi:hypothetical protein